MNPKLAFRKCGLFVVILGTLTSPSAILSQPTIEWQKIEKSFAGIAFKNVIRSDDGGYIVAGETSPTYSLNAGDIVIQKSDSNGALIWRKTYGGSQVDYVSQILQTRDHGFILVGSTASRDGDVTFNHGLYDVWVVKLDEKGAIEWQQTYGGPGADLGTGIVESQDGYSVLGERGDSQKLWLFHLDTLGKFEWERLYGGSGYELPSAICTSKDGGFVLTGETNSIDGDVSGHHTVTPDYGGLDIWVVRVDSVGKILWQRCCGGSLNEYASSIHSIDQGGYLISGATYSDDGDVIGQHVHQTVDKYPDLWVFKLSENGVLEWQRCMGGSAADVAYAAAETADRGFIISGATNSKDGDVIDVHDTDLSKWDMWLVKLDGQGTMQWQQSYGGTGYDAGNSVVQAGDLGYVVAGYTTSTDGDVVGNTPQGDTNSGWLVKLSKYDCSEIGLGFAQSELKANAGDSTKITVFSLDTSLQPVSVIDMSFQMHTDLLTPLMIVPASGQFGNGVVERFVVTADTLSVRIRLPRPRLLAKDTLFTILSKAFTTDTSETSIAFGHISFDGPPFPMRCLSSFVSSAADSVAHFTLLPSCGQTATMNLLRHEAGRSTITGITPNPSRTNLGIQLSQNHDGILRVELLDVLGREIWQTSTREANLDLDVSLFPSGSYILRATNEVGKSSSRAVAIVH